MTLLVAGWPLSPPQEKKLQPTKNSWQHLPPLVNETESGNSHLILSVTVSGVPSLLLDLIAKVLDCEASVPWTLRRACA